MRARSAPLLLFSFPFYSDDAKPTVRPGTTTTTLTRSLQERARAPRVNEECGWQSRCISHPMYIARITTATNTTTEPQAASKARIGWSTNKCAERGSFSCLSLESIVTPVLSPSSTHQPALRTEKHPHQPSPSLPRNSSTPYTYTSAMFLRANP
jgi:hypothetical protein